MKRKAKDKHKRIDLIDYVLEDYSFDSMPIMSCPVFKRSVSTYYCATKCPVFCPDYQDFSHIIDKCLDETCTRKAPCSECNGKVEEYKELVQFYRAINSTYDKDKSINKRIRKFKEKSQKIFEDMGDKHKGVYYDEMIEGVDEE